MKKPNIIRLLEINAYEVYSATLVGNATPHTQALHKWITNPRVGDLVLETSTLYHEEITDRLGYLRAVDLIDGEMFYTIETLNGDTKRWQNARFIRVVEDLRHLNRDIDAMLTGSWTIPT